MEINLPLLLKYIKKNGTEATINIQVDQPGACLVFILGKNHEGGRREYVDFSDLNDILQLNNIIGKTAQSPSLVCTQLDLPHEHPGWRKRAGAIEHLVYDTLSKYIIQLLSASHGKLYYRDIKPLAKHEMYFRDR
ncbi:MAG: hypothetical protein BGO55_01475 [Sphingobacteriales bacterium 50-39]|nr:hypothetical protein [Sphingobacteriales bacterium]OJW53776.1 MAG: hypothetical protein BGO55_01475 [Sphingobacteriales bacterium 50-39]